MFPASNILGVPNEPEKAAAKVVELQQELEKEKAQKSALKRKVEELENAKKKVNRSKSSSKSAAAQTKPPATKVEKKPFEPLVHDGYVYHRISKDYPGVPPPQILGMNNPNILPDGSHRNPPIPLSSHGPVTAVVKESKKSANWISEESSEDGPSVVPVKKSKNRQVIIDGRVYVSKE